MRKLSLTIAAVFLFVLLTMSFAACNTNTGNEEADSQGEDDAVLLFSDDFDTLDETKWNVYTAKTATDNGWGVESGVRKGGYWDKEQVFTEEGKLVIRTEKKGNAYYTGAIDTDQKFEIHYGYYEAKVMLPKAYGLWSAFWIMCNDMGNHSVDAKVAGTEIDIFESPYYRPTDPEYGDSYQSALHIGDYGPDPDGYTTYTWASFLNLMEPIFIYDDWHVFALDWQETYYRFYLDGVMMAEYTLDGNISDRDSFLFLSVEIGGSNGVASNPPFIGTSAITKNADGVLPVDFLVDYVKVWDKKPTA